MKLTYRLPDGRLIGRAPHGSAEPFIAGVTPLRAIRLSPDGANILENPIRIRFPEAEPVPAPSFNPTTKQWEPHPVGAVPTAH